MIVVSENNLDNKKDQPCEMLAKKRLDQTVAQIRKT